MVKQGCTLACVVYNHTDRVISTVAEIQTEEMDIGPSTGLTTSAAESARVCRNNQQQGKGYSRIIIAFTVNRSKKAATEGGIKANLKSGKISAVGVILAYASIYKIYK